ncbi:hypothetical protein Q3G72_008833 [Acer saccharum]|nr:hypothetical protein Q3G72_008833 [Acer saccharum]
MLSSDHHPLALALFIFESNGAWLPPKCLIISNPLLGEVANCQFQTYNLELRLHSITKRSEFESQRVFAWFVLAFLFCLAWCASLVDVLLLGCAFRFSVVVLFCSGLPPLLWPCCPVAAFVCLLAQ